MALGLSSYRPPIMGITHVVSAGQYLAAAAGYRILEQGGNAVDAGVASGIVINVTLPENTSFGGVAPIMVYMAGMDEPVTISGLGRWPRAATIEHFHEKHNSQIPLGVDRSVVPAAPDAWLTALELYGTMTFEQVVTPALEIAEHATRCRNACKAHSPHRLPTKKALCGTSLRSARSSCLTTG